MIAAGSVGPEIGSQVGRTGEQRGAPPLLVRDHPSHRRQPADAGPGTRDASFMRQSTQPCLPDANGNFTLSVEGLFKFLET